MAERRRGFHALDFRQQLHPAERESAQHAGTRREALVRRALRRIGKEIVRVRQQFKIAGPTSHVTAGGSTPSGES